MRILIVFAAALLAGCGGEASENKKGGGAAPLVTAGAVASARFVDRIDAVGTARANEQVTLTAAVTERVERLAFDDGDFVGRGQVVAVLARGQETAQLAEAGAREREARQQLSRLQELGERGFATRSAIDAQQALAGQASAQAAQARAAIGDRVVRAPFGGYVSLRNISAGAVINAGGEIVTISDISRIKLDFAVPETLLSQIAVGQSIEARSAAFPETPFRGTIDVIDPVINPATRAVTVRAVLPNPDGMLKPGMLLTVGIESAARTAVSVPELAVVGEGQQSFVFVVDGDRVRRTQVRVGQRQGGMVEILEGLRPGQRIVTEGVVKVTDGQEVRLAGPANATPTPRSTGAPAAGG